MSDKRQHTRFALWFPVKIDALSVGRQKAIIVDASAGGVLIGESQELIPGEAVTISFEVPGEGEKFFLGHIVRIEGDEKKGEKAHRVAIEFVEPIPELERLFTRASILPPPAV
jgi:hypothetical protein